jgi:hypothetical protein
MLVVVCNLFEAPESIVFRNAIAVKQGHKAQQLEFDSLGRHPTSEMVD